MDPNKDLPHYLEISTIPQIRQKFGPLEDGTPEYLVALKLYSGLGIPEKNTSAAFSQFLKAAEKGHPESLYMVAHLYNVGEGTPKNWQKYTEFMEKSAKAGHPLAQHFYGATLTSGLLGEGKFNEGIEWIKKAADQGVGDAIVNLGVMAQQGLDNFGNKIEPDYEKAFELFKKAAEKKSYAATYFLAISYQTGLIGGKNNAKAKKLFDEILNSKSLDSYLFKALMYETGSGTGKNLENARNFYEICIQQNPNDVIANTGLKRINEEIEEHLKKEQELLKEYDEASSPNSSHNKVTQKSYSSSSKKKKNDTTKKPSKHPEILLEEVPLPTSSGTSDEALKEMLNTALSYDDESLITEIDSKNNKIVIKKPYDDSAVTIILNQRKAVTPEDIKHLTKFAYEDRVSKWFGGEEGLLAKYNQEQIDRHRFAQRVDEIAQLYGDTAVFMKNDGTLQENKILLGHITTKDNRKLNGTFEYACYQNEDKEKVLYHRFLHPRSKAITT